MAFSCHIRVDNLTAVWRQLWPPAHDVKLSTQTNKCQLNRLGVLRHNSDIIDACSGIIVILVVALRAAAAFPQGSK